MGDSKHGPSKNSNHSRQKTKSNERAKKRRNGQQDGHQMNHHKNMSMATNHGSRSNINARNRNTQQIAGVLEEENLDTPPVENTRIRAGAYTAFKATMAHEELDDITSADRVDVAVKSDAFTYDKENDTFTISLSNVEIVRQNDITGKLTIKLKAYQINREKSGRAEDDMDDKYVGDMLDEILDNY